MYLKDIKNAAYNQDVLENETCYKTGRVSTRDFTVCIWIWS